jgi:glycosyltransferase involved in cell wall biosynthesis
MMSFSNTKTSSSTDWLNSICILSTGLHPIGGAEMQVSELAKALHTREWHVRVVSMLPATGEIQSELTRLGIPVHSLGMTKGTADPRAILRLGKLIREYRPSILHSHMIHANLLARITRAVVHVPFQISTVHSIQEGGRLRELAYRLTDHWADKTTAISEAAAHRYVDVGAARLRNMRVIPNGVDTARFRPDFELRKNARTALALEENFIWLAAGRICEAKDYTTLLHAFAMIPDNKAVLLIAGDGPGLAELRGLAVALGIAKRTHFLGFRTDTAALMNAADGYVMSSRYEGMPMVLLEASACALPIVATDVGGNAEVVKSGRLVPPACPSALGQAMCDVMAQSNEVRIASGAAGRDYTVRHFSMENVISQWEHLYRSLLEVDPPSASRACSH